MSKTKIIYKDVAVGAAEDASVSASGAMAGSVPSKLPDGVSPPPIITLERNAWRLNGRYRARGSHTLAFWSSTLSGEDCMFQASPVITIDFDQQYSSTGITLFFDTATGDHCALVNVKWYQGTSLKADVDFEPDSAEYFCRQTVTSYNRVVVTLKKTSLPYRRAKLDRIMFGVHRSFGMTEIRNASIISDMDLLSAELPVSTSKWTLDSREDVEYMFQFKQPVETWNDDALICVHYINNSKRTAGGLYDVSCHDAFGVLDETPFPGGVYSGKSAKALLEEILGGDFILDCQAEDTALTGVIQAGTKRGAVQQVLFAWGVCASTFGTEKIRVFSPSSAPTEIGRDRTFPGASVDTAAIVTKVTVTAHTYVQDSNGGVEIGGAKYKDTETVYTVVNPNVTAADKQNVVEVTGATLVSTSIGQAVAQRVYDYYARRSTHKAKIVWRGERLGDCVTVPNSWGGTVTGNLTRMEVSLSNTVVSNCETVGV